MVDPAAVYRRGYEIYDLSVADLRGAPGSKFFHFHAVFGHKLVSTPTLGVGAPSRSATAYFYRFGYGA